MIDFINVSMIYPSGYCALRNVSFSIKESEMVMLFGPSGSGKTSIFNLLLRLVTPSQGRILINQQDISRIDIKELPQLRRYISMVFQIPQLLLNETVFNNVALPLLAGGYRQQHINSRVTAALKKTGLLPKAKLKAADLSSGEKKLAEIARAIVTVPKILLVDEPTSNVDAATAIKILKLFKAFNQVGMTLLISTHHQNLLADIPTRALFIHDGTLQTEVSHA